MFTNSNCKEHFFVMKIFKCSSDKTSLVRIYIYHTAKCDKGEYYNDIPTQGCQKCPLGYYQDEEYNQYSCTKCFPAGTTTIVEGEDSQSDCTGNQVQIYF